APFALASRVSGAPFLCLPRAALAFAGSLAAPVELPSASDERASSAARCSASATMLSMDWKIMVVRSRLNRSTQSRKRRSASSMAFALRTGIRFRQARTKHETEEQWMPEFRVEHWSLGFGNPAAYRA